MRPEKDDDSNFIVVFLLHAYGFHTIVKLENRNSAAISQSPFAILREASICRELRDILLTLSQPH